VADLRRGCTPADCFGYLSDCEQPFHNQTILQNNQPMTNYPGKLGRKDGFVFWDIG
jgi:hypothetical protein